MQNGHPPTAGAHDLVPPEQKIAALIGQSHTLTEHRQFVAIAIRDDGGTPRLVIGTPDGHAHTYGLSETAAAQIRAALAPRPQVNTP